ncbi:hypothetical protein GCM10023169_11600 [Georgenia halophila]|uniref:N-acetyltransferase domain-containing protein n=1 Tax=Georgenia halophila TaxID=620889 RepID=A0ABP8KTY1_9MICO
MPTRNAPIRPATVLDTAAVAAVHLQAWRETFGDRVPEEVYTDRAVRWPGEWEATLADPDGPATWLAERDGEAVGVAQAVATGAGKIRSLELKYLFVLAAEHGRRTGTHLLELAVGDAPCLLWVVEDSEEAIGFYRQHGFELDGARRPAVDGHLTEVRMLR